MAYMFVAPVAGRGENLCGTWAEDSGLRSANGGVEGRVWWGKVVRSGRCTDYPVATEMGHEGGLLGGNDTMRCLTIDSWTGEG